MVQLSVKGVRFRLRTLTVQLSVKGVRFSLRNTDVFTAEWMSQPSHHGCQHHTHTHTHTHILRTPHTRKLPHRPTAFLYTCTITVRHWTIDTHSVPKRNAFWGRYKVIKVCVWMFGRLIAAGTTMSWTQSFSPWRVGPSKLVASLDCAALRQVHGYTGGEIHTHTLSQTHTHS